MLMITKCEGQILEAIARYQAHHNCIHCTIAFDDIVEYYKVICEENVRRFNPNIRSQRNSINAHAKALVMKLAAQPIADFSITVETKIGRGNKCIYTVIGNAVDALTRCQKFVAKEKPKPNLGPNFGKIVLP